MNGVNHLGIQTDRDEELDGLRARMDQAEVAAVAEKNSACCHHRANKYGVTDPNGIAWETFHTLGEVPTFSEAGAIKGAAACRTPEAALPAKIEVKARATSCGGA